MKKIDGKWRKSLVGSLTLKKLKSLREEVVKLTSLLKQALRSKPEEAKSTAQPEPMLVNLFNPQNLGANGLSSDF